MNQKTSVTNRVNPEYEIFKEFILQLRKQINKQSTSFNGLKPSAIVLQLIDELDNLLVAVEFDSVQGECGMKQECLKIATIAYKMWREL